MKNFLTKTPVVITLALICCALWGSSFPCIKIGYRMFAIGGNDTASQILFAGIRFLLAGLMVIIICSFIYKRPLAHIMEQPSNRFLSCRCSRPSCNTFFSTSVWQIRPEARLRSSKRQMSFWQSLYRVCYLKWKRLHRKRCSDV